MMMTTQMVKKVSMKLLRDVNSIMTWTSKLKQKVSSLKFGLSGFCSAYLLGSYNTEIFKKKFQI